MPIPDAARNPYQGAAVLILLIILLVLTLGGGAWGHGRFGAAGWSPLGIIIVLLAILYFTGNLR